MRVALVIERFERGGGMENAAWNAARGLVRAGDEVHVIARRGEEAPGVRLHPVRVPTAWQPLRVAAFSRAAAAAARRLACDVVHGWSRTRHQDVYRAGGGSHADYMQRAYGARGAALRRLSPRHALLLALERAIFTDPRQRVQCGSDMVRAELAARFGVPSARLAVIPNGVDPEQFRPAGDRAERARLREALDPRAGATCFLLAGSGWHRKGLDTALAALARCADPDTRLWVAGRDDPAPWHARVARLGLSERVRFLGARGDMRAVYAAADALLLPTRYDAFANVCLEASACGLPVVTSGANGSAPLVAEAGHVVEDPEDVDGFAAALDALADPAARSRLGDRARELACRHSWEHHVEALRALFAEVAA